MKTALCEALADKYKLPLIEISLTDSSSKYVGESEKNAKRVFNALKQIPEAIIYFDEIEKQISGAGSSHSGDSGTGTKVMGELLKFLQERTAGRNLVLFTANNIETLKQNCPEILRAGRIDATFYVDFPTEEETEQLIALYSKKYGLEEEIHPIDEILMHKYTGSEIETLYRITSMLDCTLLEGMDYVKPISKTYDSSKKDQYMQA